MEDKQIVVYKEQIARIEKQIADYLKAKLDASSTLTVGGYKVDLCIPKKDNNVVNWPDECNIWKSTGILIGGKYEIDGAILNTIIHAHSKLMETLPDGHVTTTVSIGKIQCTLRELEEVKWRIEKEHGYIRNSVSYDERDYFRKEVFSKAGKTLK